MAIKPPTSDKGVFLPALSGREPVTIPYWARTYDSIHAEHLLNEELPGPKVLYAIACYDKQHEQRLKARIFYKVHCSSSGPREFITNRNILCDHTNAEKARASFTVDIYRSLRGSRPPTEPALPERRINSNECLQSRIKFPYDRLLRDILGFGTDNCGMEMAFLVHNLEYADKGAQFSRLPDLPPELRDVIYKMYLDDLSVQADPKPCIKLQFGHEQPPTRLNCLIRNEALPVSYERIPFMFSIDGTT